MSRTPGGAYQSGGKPVEELKPPPGRRSTDHAQCHRDIDQLLAEVKRLRVMLRLCEEHCSDGWVAQQARDLLAYSVERHIDGLERSEKEQ